MNHLIPDFSAAAEAGQLNFVVRNIAAVHRLTRFPDTEPWWGTEGKSRFDDALRKYGVSYAAETLEASFAETVIHEHASFSFYEQVPQAQGICYVSRQLNTQCVIALFERSGVRGVPRRIRLDRHPDFGKVIRKLSVAFT